jgi:hypothetical protein
VADKESGTNYLQIICVWQKGADALMEEYRQMASTLPIGENLEVMVLTKEELMNKYLTNDQGTETTFQINNICKNIGVVEKDREAHLYIDECWITAPKKCDAHLTLVSTVSKLLFIQSFAKFSFIWTYLPLFPFLYKTMDQPAWLLRNEPI